MTLLKKISINFLKVKIIMHENFNNKSMISDDSGLYLSESME